MNACMTGARFFAWLQDADFYRGLHRDAVALVRRAGSWLDVGTGAGVVATLAAQRGHQVVGVDRSVDMVKIASANADSRVEFHQGDLEHLTQAGRTFDTVSAASLLINAPSPLTMLEQLWSLVKPRGTLLIIETTPHMRPHRAVRLMHGKRAQALLLWSLARRGRSAAGVVDAFRPQQLATSSRVPLCDGLVAAWVFTRS